MMRQKVLLIVEALVLGSSEFTKEIEARLAEEEPGFEIVQASSSISGRGYIATTIVLRWTEKN